MPVFRAGELDAVKDILVAATPVEQMDLLDGLNDGLGTERLGTVLVAIAPKAPELAHAAALAQQGDVGRGKSVLVLEGRAIRLYEKGDVPSDDAIWRGQYDKNLPAGILGGQS